MSGHSKWHSIKHKKGAADAVRGKIFTRHANLITIAARSGGGDPIMNPALRLAIDNAKADNVPNANIERAVKRGTGDLKEGAQIEELTYEGYGPGGTAILVECLTDNKNRTVTNLRTLFGKHGGNLGSSGSVAWMFERKGVIRINGVGKNSDDVELAAIDAGADDVEKDGENFVVTVKPTNLTPAVNKLKEGGITVESAQVQMIPNQTVVIEDEATAKKVLDFVEALDEDLDVNNVSGNFEISTEIINALS